LTSEAELDAELELLTETAFFFLSLFGLDLLFIAEMFGVSLVTKALE